MQPEPRRERPVIVTGALVPAVLDGRKTRTRRLIRRPARAGEYSFGEGLRAAAENGWTGFQKRGPEDGLEWRCACPYGAPGDRLWVREPWALSSFGGGDTAGPWVAIRYLADRTVRTIPGVEWPGGGKAGGRTGFGGRPSIHMPRWAARLTLNITAVRVERLQDITEEEARAEGLPPNWLEPIEGWRPDEHGWLTPAGLYSKQVDTSEDEIVQWRGQSWRATAYSAREAFEAWWDHLAPEGSRWADDPWVWAVSFERHA